eukprot:scaffold326797_cov42-Prasinocladus_malaysianus.AAC.1
MSSWKPSHNIIRFIAWQSDQVPLHCGFICCTHGLFRPCIAHRHEILANTSMKEAELITFGLWALPVISTDGMRNAQILRTWKGGV